MLCFFLQILQTCRLLSWRFKTEDLLLQLQIYVNAYIVVNNKCVKLILCLVFGHGIMKTCPCNVYPLTPHFCIVKLGFTGLYIIFIVFALKHILGVLEQSTENCHFYSREKSLYIAWACFRYAMSRTRVGKKVESVLNPNPYSIARHPHSCEFSHLDNMSVCFIPPSPHFYI